MRIHKTRGGGIRFASLPRSGQAKISVNTLNELANHVTVTDTEITFITEAGPVVFDIVTPPGRWCLTCGEKLPDVGSTAAAEAENAQACRDHVATHGNKAEKSVRWPDGYSHHAKHYVCKAQDSELNAALIAATR